MNKTQEKTKIAVSKAVSGLPATDSMNQAAAMLSLIERLAQNPDVDINKMTAILDMQERILNRNSEIAFNRDFAKMSQDIPRIQKDGTVTYDKVKGKPELGQEEAFKFALYEDIDEIIRPILDRHGFVLSFTTSERQGGGLTVNGILAHKEGHSRTTSLPLALDTSGGKNNLQAMGSSSSYGRRYAACILLNIITVDEDDNGKADGMAKTDAQKIGDAVNFHEGIEKEYEGKPFKNKEEVKTYMLSLKELIESSMDEDAINSLIDEHGTKITHLHVKQQKALNDLFRDAKDKFAMKEMDNAAQNRMN